ncbi:hypothetical protein ILUMI_20321 [Ignelater luminosus]|uniref:Sulfotransferase domain-containing protein n=1 Tax=Ignelater luminosus TaxID=2038154 RepID=A0A8K0G2E4_IGNLU|nr:hypothetical protein ILUMI_20321 [Ignelater luminosus]
MVMWKLGKITFVYQFITNITKKQLKRLKHPALFDMTKLFKDKLDMHDLGYYRILEQKESPRPIKSHLHWSLLPEEIRNGSK